MIKNSSIIFSSSWWYCNLSYSVLPLTLEGEPQHRAFGNSCSMGCRKREKSNAYPGELFCFMARKTQYAFP